MELQISFGMSFFSYFINDSFIKFILSDCRQILESLKLVNKILY
jgi:hypothetical protein